MSKKKRRKRSLMPRKGPPVNLRPAGAHDSLVQYNRKRQKAAVRRETGEDFAGYDRDVD